MPSLKARLRGNAMMSLVRPDKEREIGTLDKVYTRLMLGDRAELEADQRQSTSTEVKARVDQATRQQKRKSARMLAKRDRLKQRIDEKRQIG